MNPGNLTRAQRRRLEAAIAAVTLACAEELSAVAAFTMAAGPGPGEDARTAARDRLAVAGGVLADAARVLVAAWPDGESPPVTVAGNLAGSVSGVLRAGGRVFLVTSADDVRAALLRASAGPGHDVPHWASGPQIGAPGPVHAVCVCRCAGCCGHRPGQAPARGESGRCPGCSCYLAPDNPASPEYRVT